MIRAENYWPNITLECMLQSLRRGIRQEDAEAIEGLTSNISYLLAQTAKLEMPYNALEVHATVFIKKRELPAVQRNVYRPHQYLQDIEMLGKAGTAQFYFVLPVPLEMSDKNAPYALCVKTYTSEHGKRVFGLTINLGKPTPHHLFFYANEISHLSFGHAVQQEYPPLRKTTS